MGKKRHTAVMKPSMYDEYTMQSVVEDSGESAQSITHNPPKWFNQILQEFKAMASSLETKQNEQPSGGWRRRNREPGRPAGDPPILATAVGKLGI